MVTRKELAHFECLRQARTFLKDLCLARACMDPAAYPRQRMHRYGSSHKQWDLSYKTPRILARQC